MSIALRRRIYPAAHLLAWAERWISRHHGGGARSPVCIYPDFETNRTKTEEILKRSTRRSFEGGARLLEIGDSGTCRGAHYSVFRRCG